MALNGIIMISPALNFETIGFAFGNDLPYILFVPGYAAAAWYHKALPGDLQALSLEEVVKQATEFALNDYTLAMMKGQSLSDKRTQRGGGETGTVHGAVQRIRAAERSCGSVCSDSPKNCCVSRGRVSRPLRQPLQGHRRRRRRRDARIRRQCRRPCSVRSRRQSTTICTTI